MPRAARRLLAAALALGALGAAGWLALWPRGLPPQPQPVAWNRQTCARCRMLIGEPAHAAQLQTEDGEVFHFDDPGCLLRFAAEHRPRTRAVFYHAGQGEGWIPGARAGFVPGGPTPMGYGLVAVERAGRPDALDAEQALARVRARDAARRGE